MSTSPNRPPPNVQVRCNGKTRPFDALKARKQKGARIVIWTASATLLALAMLALIY
jgi:hypothetical protein